MTTAPQTGLLHTLLEQRVASRIWSRDTTVFAPAGTDPAVHASVASRLGWLDAPAAMPAHIAGLRAVARDARDEGLDRICLLGMGGSSLCAEVLRDVLVPTARSGPLSVFDTTDERAIDRLTRGLDARRTMFIVASKSGTTVEVRSLERYFRALMTRALGDRTGRHFIAITDPGTPLVAHAREQAYRATFLNPPDIGGRYSALSLFGLVPGCLLGIDPGELLGSAARMAERCRRDTADNPGLALGAFLASSVAEGRDKLTLLLPESLEPLGAWIEQLIAESTGKHGRGLLPIVAEPAGQPADYGTDRTFVALVAADSRELIKRAETLVTAGHAVFRVEAARGELGAEFFRWEFATAVAGAAMGINPFNEPNVREAKARTQALLDAFHETGALRVEPPLKPRETCFCREHRPAGDVKPSYFAVLDYLPQDDARRAVADRFRRRMRTRSRTAATYGAGPRYLHSTGQFHKGGPPGGRFILLTAADETTTDVPEAGYTFSVLKQAQALGDFEALVAAGRSVVHYHFDDPSADFSRELDAVLLLDGR